MRHTHHSYVQQHWDTNVAAVTSIWDRMLGGKPQVAEPVTPETLIKN
jgi:sterol desaturase/sphingolipid hydroxylase (fatty acid hydroxylase superfamily)